MKRTLKCNNCGKIWFEHGEKQACPERHTKWETPTKYDRLLDMIEAQTMEIKKQVEVSEKILKKLDGMPSDNYKTLHAIVTAVDETTAAVKVTNEYLKEEKDHRRGY
jgi:hypothetical protein